MGKRWNEEQEAIMFKHYLTAQSVDDVADMLGRSRSSVVKKGLAMGLHRPNLQVESINRFLSVLSDVPMSVAEISASMGIGHHAVNDLMRRPHITKLCHIAAYRPTGGRGKDAPLWVLGAGENAPSTTQLQRSGKVKEETKPRVFRDPFIEIMFGRAVATVSKPIAGRVYKQSMEVTEDELEAA